MPELGGKLELFEGERGLDLSRSVARRRARSTLRISALRPGHRRTRHDDRGRRSWLQGRGHCRRARDLADRGLVRPGHQRAGRTDRTVKGRTPPVMPPVRCAAHGTLFAEVIRHRVRVAAADSRLRHVAAPGCLVDEIWGCRARGGSRRPQLYGFGARVLEALRAGSSPSRRYCCRRVVRRPRIPC